MMDYESKRQKIETKRQSFYTRHLKRYKSSYDSNRKPNRTEPIKMNTVQMQMPIVAEAMQSYTSTLIRILSKEYGFKYDDAMDFICHYGTTDKVQMTKQVKPMDLREDYPKPSSDNSSPDTDELSEPLSDSETSITSCETLPYQVSEEEDKQIEPEPEPVPEPKQPEEFNVNVEHMEVIHKEKVEIVQVNQPKPEPKPESKPNTSSNTRIPHPKTIYPIPFTGIIYDSCNGLRNNDGLFNQCPFPVDKKSTRGFCKTCQKQADKNTHNKPNCGIIQDRMKVPYEEFKDPRGKKPITLGKYIERKSICISDVQKEFIEKNITIPEFLWQTILPNQEKKTKKPKKQEKPKKTTKVEEKPKVEETPKIEETPKVEEPKVESAPKVEEPEVDLSEELTVESYESVDVNDITINNKNYLMDDENNLYDTITSEFIGKYDDIGDEIIPRDY